MNQISKKEDLSSTENWTLADSYSHCENLARTHYENFPVASFFLKKEKRKHVAAIYTFARTADDFADEPGLSDKERLQKLDEWESLLLGAATNPAKHPVFLALGETIRQFDIPVELFQSLLKAFRQDIIVHRYKTFSELNAYCENSANPVGRLLLHLFHYRDRELHLLSDKICTALQLANFWQDISIDVRRDRLYIPLEDLRRFDLQENTLFDGNNEKVRQLIAFEVERTERLFFEGKELLSKIGTDLSFELRLTWFGGMKILEKIKKKNYDTVRERPALSIFDKIGILGSVLIQKR